MRHLKKLISVCMLFSSVLSAGIINVPADIDSIQGGINLANPGDTVLVQPGTYMETINFNGKNIVVGSLILTTGDTSYISQTIIDGDTSISPVVSFTSGEDSSAKLIGFAVQHKAIFGIGRGISIINSSPRCSYLLIKNNGEHVGGGVYCDSSEAMFMQVKVQSNHNRSGIRRLSRGGGMYCANSQLVLTEVEITQNISGPGGGIYIENSYLTLNNVVINENTATTAIHGDPTYGGGICLTNNSSAVLNNVQIRGNEHTVGWGGGIYCKNSDLYMTNVSIVDNSSNFGGGICIGFWYPTPEPDSSHIYLSNVSITNNSAVDTTFPSGTVYGGFGGGIYFDLGTSVSFDSVNRCNIYNNSADSLGNDLYNVGDSIISVIVDTFTVLNPDSSHAYPLNKFTFDILHDPSGASDISQQTNIMPANYALKQNYPNPFNPTTNIEFSIPQLEFVTLKVYNILGEEVATLVSEKLSAGKYKYDWDASGLASGVYVYRIQAGDYVETRKMILMR